MNKFKCVSTNKKFCRQTVDELKIGGEQIYYDFKATKAVREKLGFLAFLIIY